MKFLNLPAENSKKEPNIVKITCRTLHPDNKEPDIFTIPAEKFVYPQIENIQEAIQICGGTEERLLEEFNNYLRDSALSDAKNSIRLATKGTEEDIISAGIAAGKNYTFVAETAITAKEAKDFFTDLRNQASEGKMSDADLLAAMKAKFGIA